MNTRDFQDDLQQADKHADEPFWEKIYKGFFPTFASMEKVPINDWRQGLGIDRVITLRNGKLIMIEEKRRWEDYPTFVLEIWSNEEKALKGWTRRDLSCDYLAYAIIPSRTCYLLPWHALQLACRHNWAQWLDDYPQRIRNRNEDRDSGDKWTSVAFAVPRSIVLQAMTEAMRVIW